MTFSFIEAQEGENPHVIVHGDCDGLRKKEVAVFAARLLAPDGDTPADLAPRPFEDVVVEVTPDTTRTTAEFYMARAGVELRLP